MLKTIPKSQSKLVANIIKSSELVTHFKDDGEDSRTVLVSKEEAISKISSSKEIVLKTKTAVKKLDSISMLNVERMTIVMGPDEWYTVYPTKMQAKSYLPRHVHLDLKL